jgi:hypothetical protein
MSATAEIVCSKCEARVIVFPSSLYGLVPENVEADFMAHLHETETEDGKRFAVADGLGSWKCPVCGRESIVPVVDFS